MIDQHNIKRLEVNEYGEIPLSYGRYVRWEDFLEVVEAMQGQIDNLQQDLENADCENDYDSGYSDGLEDGKAIGYAEGQDDAWEDAREAYDLK